MPEFSRKKLQEARRCIGRLADGLDPITNQPFQDPILEMPYVIRCLAFVSNVLEAVNENGGIVGSQSSLEKDDSEADEMEGFPFKRDASVSEVVTLARAHFKAKGIQVRGLTAKNVNLWLETHGYLKKAMPVEGFRTSWMPTPKGEAAGIYPVLKAYDNRQFATPMYSEEAQRFLFGQMKAMLRQQTTDSRQQEKS